MTRTELQLIFKLIADLIEAKAKNKKEAADIVRDLLKDLNKS